MNKTHRDRRLPPLPALKSFEAAARHGSFTRAADELRVTHSAVSHQVRLLEEWLGKPLFHRRGKRVELTEAGRVFADRLGGAFDDIDTAVRSLLSDPRPAHRLCINSLPTFAMRWLLPRLAQFQFAQPQVELRLVTSDTTVTQLVPASFDVAIRRAGGALPKGFEEKAFLTEQEAPVLSPSLASQSMIERAEDLLALPLLVADTRPGAWDRWFGAAGIDQLPANVSFQRFEHFYLALQAAVDGLGVALGPRPLVDEELENGRLVVPLAGPSLSLAPYCWIVSEEKKRDPVLASFLVWLEQAGKRADDVVV